MMDAMEREQALRAMRASADAFYRSAVQIGVHPFIEFAGLMNEYLLACAQAHAQGIDFSECNRHSGQALPLHPVMSDYINEKLGFDIPADEQRAALEALDLVITHEEPTDEKLQAQPQCTWFVEQIMGAWTDTVSELAAIKEGAGTLLDNCMIVAH